MEKMISVVIPNHNGEKNIGRCLEAACASDYHNFEVVVVDDCSDDRSVEIIQQYPCTLIRLGERSGASKARNTGAIKSRGEIIFFTDSDCLLQRDTLSLANRAMSSAEPDVAVGGTYTLIPYDEQFFSTFQSVFVHYSETKNLESPDYLAAHAMIIHAETFRKSRGFPEVFLPIMEDLEYSHRLKRSGVKLRMVPEIQVKHIFNFSFSGSLLNAFKKTRYWVMYSQKNRDMLTDSGCASIELKFSVFSFLLNVLIIAASLLFQKPELLLGVPIILLANVLLCRKLIHAFYRAEGALFSVLAFSYFTMCYPFPVGLGTITGILNYHLSAGIPEQKELKRGG